MKLENQIIQGDCLEIMKQMLGKLKDKKCVRILENGFTTHCFDEHTMDTLKHLPEQNRLNKKICTK